MEGVASTFIKQAVAERSERFTKGLRAVSIDEQRAEFGWKFPQSDCSIVHRTNRHHHEVPTSNLSYGSLAILTSLREIRNSLNKGILVNRSLNQHGFS